MKTCQWCRRHAPCEEVEIAIRLKDGGGFAEWTVRLCDSCQFERVSALKSRVMDWYGEHWEGGVKAKAAERSAKGEG